MFLNWFEYKRLWHILIYFHNFLLQNFDKTKKALHEGNRCQSQVELDNSVFCNIRLWGHGTGLSVENTNTNNNHSGIYLFNSYRNPPPPKKATSSGEASNLY
jgi:hypothetical protein